MSLLLPPAFWLGAWQLCAFLVDRHVQGRGNELLLPYPATVLAALMSPLGHHRELGPGLGWGGWGLPAGLWLEGAVGPRKGERCQ